MLKINRTWCFVENEGNRVVKISVRNYIGITTGKAVYASLPQQEFKALRVWGFRHVKFRV